MGEQDGAVDAGQLSTARTELGAPRGFTDEAVDGFPAWLGDGHFRRDRRLGRGGMGVVYRYRDIRLDRLVAVKTMPASLARSPDQRERFRQEARVAASLNHDNVAKIWHVLEQDGSNYLILEYVPGETLARILFDGAMPLPRALSVGLQTARAIEAGHALSIIHRDVKPGNIMVTPDGTAKLLDYGLARYQTEAAADHRGSEAPTVVSSTGTTASFRTLEGQVMGTPGYISPEQASGRPVDGRTDIWAFGCVMYECFTGRPAFPGETQDKRIEATHRHEPDWSALPEALPRAAGAVLRECLTKDPRRRAGRMSDIRRIFRDAAGAMESEAAPVSVPCSLPEQLSTYVSRAGELQRLREMMQAARLLTLSGLGGSGKTRLAIQLARDIIDYPGAVPGQPVPRDGIWFVELAPLTDPERVPQAVASTLLGHAYREQTHGHPIVQTLIDHIRDRTLLLVLDNCEHLVAACRELVETLLRHCSNLRVVATSRESLHISGERTYVVPELSFPAGADPADAGRYESVRLFADRAALQSTDFKVTAENAEAVGEICRRLEGIPQAIELAAARVGSMPLDQLATRLFDVLDPDQVLHSSIEWSIRLLPASEQALLGRLSVCRGGWSLEAAEAIGGDDASSAVQGRPVIDLLRALVEKSLVRYVEQGGRARYRMLETVRQYVHEHLIEADEAEAIRPRHLAFYLELARRADEHFSDVEQTAWLDRIEVEHENLRSALSFSVDERVDPALGANLAKSLHMFWCVRGYLAEGRSWLEAVLRRRVGVVDVLQSQAFNALGIVAGAQRDFACAHQSYRSALKIVRRLGDRPREAGILTNLGLLAHGEADHRASREYHEEALAVYRGLGDHVGVAMVQLNLADVLKTEGALEDGHTMLEACLPVFRKAGDQQRIAAALHNLGEIAQRGDRPGRAEVFLKRALEIRKELRDKESVSRTLLWLSVNACQKGEYERTARLMAASDAMQKDADSIMMPSDTAEYERCLEAVCRELPGDSRSRAWDLGAALSFDQAVEYALHDEISGPPSGSGGVPS